jgi:hypothetical protein
MRMHPVLILIVGVSLSACADPAGDLAGGPVSSSIGTLVVSTATVGDDPDPDGYQLTVDDAASLDLGPTETTEIDLPSGRHSLRLLGVAGHCTVTPATPFEVDVPAGSTTPGAFQVGCPGTTIRVAVTTTGLDPDQDGYQLTIDGVSTLALIPTGTAQVNVAPGRHTLQLLGVAEHCSVASGTVLELDFARGTTTPVAYQVECPLTGAHITMTTTGGDLDVDGYLVEVDGTDRGVVLPNAALVVRLDPGSRTIALTGLAPNCTIDGPASRTVTIVDNEAVPIEFAVVCTGSRTLRLTILNQVYPDPAAYTSVQITLDGEVHDVQVPTGRSTFSFGGLGSGTHSLQAQFYYYAHGWSRCHSTQSLHSFVEPVSTTEADTTGVELEIVSTVHCHFL